MTTRVAIIGCGHWGVNHIRNFKNIKDAKVTIVADVNEARLAETNRLHGPIQTSTDFEKAITGNESDAVVIATPASTHFKLAMAALKTGKHVLCEKPMATTAKEAEQLAKTAKDAGRILMVGNTFLFNPGIQKLKDIVEQDKTDRIYYVTSTRTNLGPIREDVSVLYDLASHDIAIFNFLFNSAPLKVNALGASYLRNGVEDIGLITLTYANSLVAHILVSWLNPRKVRQITLVSEKKMVIWDEFGSPSPVTVYNKGVIKEPYYKDYAEFIKLTMWETDVNHPPVDKDEPLKVQNMFFIDAIRSGKLNKSDAEFNVNIVRTLEAAQKSIKENGSAVNL